MVNDGKSWEIYHSWMLLGLIPVKVRVVPPRCLQLLDDFVSTDAVTEGAIHHAFQARFSFSGAESESFGRSVYF